MPKMVTYRVDGYDGGLNELPEPSAEGTLQLSDTRWSLTFPDHEVGVSGGLLRSEFDIEAVDRRRSVLRLRTDGGAGTCSMIVLAPAKKVEKIVALRLAELTRLCQDTDGAARGQWWRDSQAFSELGPLHTVSIGGVRYEGGWWRDDRVRPTRRRAVLDFTPEGLVLRKWRRKLFLPWALVDSLEILAGPTKGPELDGDGDDRPGDSEAGDVPPTTMVVRSPSGRTARFTTALMTPDTIRHRLAPILERLGSASLDWPGTAPTT